MAYIVMAFVVVVYVGFAYVVMAHIVMAYIVMAGARSVSACERMVDAHLCRRGYTITNMP